MSCVLAKNALRNENSETNSLNGSFRMCGLCTGKVKQWSPLGSSGKFYSPAQATQAGEEKSCDSFNSKRKWLAVCFLEPVETKCLANRK